MTPHTHTHTVATPLIVSFKINTYPFSYILVLIITTSFLSLRIIVSLKINTTITTYNTHTVFKISTITTYNNYVISFTAYHRILVKIAAWKVDGYSIIAP